MVIEAGAVKVAPLIGEVMLTVGGLLTVATAETLSKVAVQRAEALWLVKGRPT